MGDSGQIRDSDELDPSHRWGLERGKHHDNNFGIFRIFESTYARRYPITRMIMISTMKTISKSREFDKLESEDLRRIKASIVTKRIKIRLILIQV